LPEQALRINRDVSIPHEELTFRFTRASGPGGQNVNRTSTRVELLFDVAHSPSLTDVQRTRVRHRLRNDIDSLGVLHLVSQASSSQWRNRQDVLARLQRVMAGALRAPRRRIATRPTQASRERRLRKKQLRARVKRSRSRVHREEG
jgi:ribosome-associated protein